MLTEYRLGPRERSNRAEARDVRCQRHHYLAGVDRTIASANEGVPSM
jgi:hypothetical protein